MECLVGQPYIEPFGCFLIVRRALELLGKHIPDYSNGLSEEHRLSELQSRLKQHAVEVADPQRGDLVLLRALGNPDHLGIMVNEREMLHCMATINTCIEPLASMRWRGRVIGYWRL